MMGRAAVNTNDTIKAYHWKIFQVKAGIKLHIHNEWSVCWNMEQCIEINAYKNERSCIQRQGFELYTIHKRFKYNIKNECIRIRFVFFELNFGSYSSVLPLLFSATEIYLLNLWRNTQYILLHDSWSVRLISVAWFSNNLFHIGFWNKAKNYCIY